MKGKIMINDILNSPIEVEIDEQAYELEFDNKSLAEVEAKTGKGIFKLLGLMVRENNLSFTDTVEILCAAMIKHHSKEEIAAVREKVSTNPWIIASNFALIQYAFAQPLIPPKAMENMNNPVQNKKAVKKKTAAKKK